MTTISINNLQGLVPITFDYQDFKTVHVAKEANFFDNGLSVNDYNIFKNVNDVSFNNSTCLVLTDIQKLNNYIHGDNESYTFGDIPVDISLQPTYSTSEYVSYDIQSKTFKTSNIRSIFNVSKINKGSNKVHITFDGSPVAVAADYPYTLYVAKKKDLLYMDENLYIFTINFIDDSTITLHTTTRSGDRFLCVGVDNTLMLTGCMLGLVPLQPYLFRVQKQSLPVKDRDFIDQNKWVTYFMSAQDRENNSTVEPKNILSAVNNFLVSFPVDKIINNDTVSINIANLKNNFTPTGASINIDNINSNINDTPAVVDYPQNASIITGNGIITFTETGIL